MANALTPDQQKALAAAAGNPVLLELLQSIINTTVATQQVTNTAGKNVPPQCKATVSFLKSNYIVQILNPGQVSPLSTLQAAQASQGATQATTLQNVTPILHQIRCATSPRFGVNDNVQVFGGDTGSPQTLWTLSNLGSGNFYFQTRDSFDGINWNQWRNANGGQSVTSNPSDVTTESALNSEWAVFTLPGNQLMAVGEGFTADEGTFNLPENLYTSAMAAIAEPNGFNDIGRHVNDIPFCDVTVPVPSDTSGLVGIPDYPIVVKMKYGDASVPQVQWGGDANTFAIAWDPAGANVTQYPSADGLSFWAAFKLAGGATLAIGQGLAADNTAIEIPAALNWIKFANCVGICSPHGDVGPDSAQGISVCGLSNGAGGVPFANCKYVNGAITWPGHANWLVIATNLPLQTVDGNPWIVINLGGGNQIAFGSGQTPNAGQITVPADFDNGNMLGIPGPGGVTGAGSNIMHGIQSCVLEAAGIVGLNYADGQGNVWNGPVNWLFFGWTTPAAPAPPGPPPPPPTIVTISPSNGGAIPPGGSVQFTATVQNNAITTVNWFVDGIAGGNGTVGNISGAGLFTTGSQTGGHTITAASTAVPTAIGTAGVYVT